MKRNIFLLFIQELTSLPLWVKQVILVYLRKDLESYLSDDLITMDEDNIFHIYRPTISKMGMEELDKKNEEYSDDIYSFLYDCANNLSILEMSIEKKYSMEDISKLFMFAYNNKYIKQEIPVQVLAIAMFIAGECMTGEYFQKIGKLSEEQTQVILSQQNEQKKHGNHTKFAELMVENGFVEMKDIKSLIKLKEEAQRKAVLDFLVPKK